MAENDELSRVKKELEEVRIWQQRQQQGLLELGVLLAEHFSELGGIKMPEGTTTHEYVAEATKRVQQMKKDRLLLASALLTADKQAYQTEEKYQLALRLAETLTFGKSDAQKT